MKGGKLVDESIGGRDYEIVSTAAANTQQINHEK
jgi:hypothetical protein